MKVKQGGVEAQTEKNREGRDQTHTHTHTNRVEAGLESERWKVSCRDEENFNQNLYLNQSCLSNRPQEIVINV